MQFVVIAFYMGLIRNFIQKEDKLILNVAILLRKYKHRAIRTNKTKLTGRALWLVYFNASIT